MSSLQMTGCAGGSSAPPPAAAARSEPEGTEGDAAGGGQVTGWPTKTKPAGSAVSTAWAATTAEPAGEDPTETSGSGAARGRGGDADRCRLPARPEPLERAGLREPERPRDVGDAVGDPGTGDRGDREREAERERI